LELEIAPHADFAIFQLAITPRLHIRSVDARRIGEQAHWVRVVVQNTGWLPTNVSQKALDRKAVRPLEVEIALPEGAALASGDRRTEAGQLDGRALKRNIYDSDASDSTTDRTKCEWVIEAPSGTTVKIEARHQRAGTVRLDVVLGLTGGAVGSDLPAGDSTQQ